MLVKRAFYNRNTIQVAKDLLGCFLVREYKGKKIKVIITETEAYRGYHDLASHASRGKTKRNKIMFNQAGHIYIYLVYGMHYMLNIVTEKKDYPAAVLIRGAAAEEKIVKKLNGPGKLTKYLYINKSLNNLDLTKREKLWIEKPKSKLRFKIIKSPRVGVDYAKHAKDWQWNFKIEKH